MSTAGRGARRVVLGDDLSSGADLAWLWVNSQRWPGWELFVLRAEPPPYGTPVPPERSEPHLAEGPPPRTVFGEPGFAAVTFQVAEADPRTALCTYDDVDLLVVGAASAGVGPWHLGSTTEWLLHGPPAPVLVARNGRPVRRVLVCADGSDHAARSLQALVSMPWIADVEVTIVAVDDGRSDVDAAVAAARGILDGQGLAGTVSVRRGSPHREIIAEQAVRDADLMVLGTRGLTPLERAVLGSTASAVARHTPAAVLIASAGTES
jgi:nucleotide-binding universal stress UspA family protein